MSPRKKPLRAASGTRAVGRALLVAAQVALGAACLVGSFVGVNWLLYRPAESQAAEPQLPQSPQLAAQPSKVAAWPEIKNGVPELLASAPAKPTPAEPTKAQPEEPSVAAAPSPARGPTFVETSLWQAQPSRPAAADEVSSQAFEGAALKPSGETAAAPESTRVAAPIELRPPSEPVASTTESAAPAIAEPAPGEPAATGDGTASGEPLPSPMAAPMPTGGSAEPRPEQASQPAARKPAQPTTAAAQPSSAKAAARTSKTSPEQRRKPSAPAPQRTRTAATAPAEPSRDRSPPPPPAEAGRATAEEEGVRVLGVRVPSARKVTECLLQWRC
jgi:hypothetical protein